MTDRYLTIAFRIAIVSFEGGLLLGAFTGNIALMLSIGMLSPIIGVAMLVYLRIVPGSDAEWMELLGSRPELLIEAQTRSDIPGEGTPSRYRAFKLRIGEQRWKERLRRSGWQPENWGLAHVTLPKDFELFPAAERVLAKYGGCHLEVPNGMKVLIDPRCCVNEYSQVVNELSQHLREPVYPIGIFDRAGGRLWRCDYPERPRLHSAAGSCLASRGEL
jgi:hypothetical protein